MCGAPVTQISKTVSSGLSWNRKNVIITLHYTAGGVFMCQTQIGTICALVMCFTT